MLSYAGDLQDKNMTFSQARFGTLTAGVTYQPSPHIAANFSLTFGTIGASDSKNGEKWFYRNLSFESKIFEMAATVEYDFFDISQPDDQSFADFNPVKFTPYIFAGLGLFHFNPYTYDLSGKKVFLQPLGTEGQTTPYSLWQVSVPFGIGAKYALSNNMVLCAELNLRKSLSDYVDDVSNFRYVDTVALLASHGPEAASLSYRADEIPGTKYPFSAQRGNPKKKDNYYSFTIKFAYQLFTHRPKFYYGY